MARGRDIARMTTATTGTGTVTLGSAVSGSLSFASAGVADGEVVTYSIFDITNSGTEVGRGTYTSSGTTLSRDTVFASTNSGSKLNLSGNAEVGVVYSAKDAEIEVNAQTGTSYTVLQSDFGKLVTFSNASAIAVTLPQATSKFSAGWYFRASNIGAGRVTITPTTSTIRGASTLVLNKGQSVTIISDGTNYLVAFDTASGGVLHNTRVAKTAAYTLTNADKGCTIDLGGTAFYTLTVGAASGFDDNFSCMIINSDTGRGKTIAANGVANFILWPGQTITLFNDNNVWKVSPSSQRWKVPNGTTIYVDVLAGANTNDGLASGSGGAVQTLAQAIRTIVKDQWDLSGSSSSPTPLVKVKLADNATAGVPSTAYSLAHIAFTPVGNEGRLTILIEGNTSNPENVVISDTSGASVGAYGFVNVQISGVQLGQTGAGSPVANAGVQASDGANVRIFSTCNFGACSNAQISALNGSRVVLDANIAVTGSAQYLAFAQNQGMVDFQSKTVTFSNSPAYSQQTISVLELSIVKVDSVTWTNGGTVTGTKYNARYNSVIVTGTGSGSVIPGTTSTGSSSSGAQVS
jgi:hypothetical protein